MQDSKSMAVRALEGDGDTISRKMAIDTIERNAYRHTYIDQIIDIIKALPPAQPQRKAGRWEMCEDSEGEYGVCSECGCDADFSRFVEPYEFCPWCGARMEGQNE